MLNKIIHFLSGTLIASVLLAITMNALDTFGLYFGILLTGTISYYAYKNHSKYQGLKQISYGMITVLLVGIISYIVLYSQLSSLLK